MLIIAGAAVVAVKTYDIDVAAIVGGIMHDPVSSLDKISGRLPTLPGEIFPDEFIPVVRKIVESAPVTEILPASNPSDKMVGALSVSGIIAATNAQRAGQSVPMLAESAQLNASAQAKAEDMLARQYFEHVAPDGTRVNDLAEREGYEYLKIGENLALGVFSDDASLVAQWMASPGHRANILDVDYTEIGIGIARGNYQGRTVYFAVQHFARPRSACPSVDDGIKSEVVAGQETLDEIEASLSKLKIEIERGIARNENVSGLIDVYNQGVEKYQSEFYRIDMLREKYNAQVTAFNQCLS